MSKLVVEVCRIDKLDPHPNADKLKIATVKGWKVCCGFDPKTNQCYFEEGEKVVYFPPDSVLPPELCNGPDDPIPGRLDATKYLKMLPKLPNGERPRGGRVAACRLRGEVSYGMLMKIRPDLGDDPQWEVGTDLAEHFGVTKWEPPVESNQGDEETPDPRFYKYTSIENFGNYPDAIPDGTEVAMSEKLHGSNSRIGYILASDDEGNPQWKKVAGSHDVQRKEFTNVTKNFKTSELGELAVWDTEARAEVGSTFLHEGAHWVIEKILERIEKGDVTIDERAHCAKIKMNDGGFEYITKTCRYWMPFSVPGVSEMLDFVVNEYGWHEDKHSVVLYGEIYGPGIQDLGYGETEVSYRTFDLAINNRYLDFDEKQKLFERFHVPAVPVLYRGPFSAEVLAEYTTGDTTVCDPAKAGKFKGREGVVVTPVVEQHSKVLCDRMILKSISADYLSRKGGTDSH